MDTGMQASFVAVATNPAIDRVARIEGAASGVVHASEMLETPGGKAVHAACVAAELGTSAAIVTTAGGRDGDLLLELLRSEPLAVHPVTVAGPTRGTYTLVEASGADLVEVHQPGGSLTEAEAERLVTTATRLVDGARVVAVSGSLPPGAPAELHARLIEAARERGAFTILDCSTASALAAGLAAGPDLVAPNLAEVGRLLGAELESRPSDAELARITDAIRERGAAAVWLSLGPHGSVLAGVDASFRLAAPAPARIVNVVGCGDALIGGFAAGLSAGHDSLSAAVLGAAAATEKLAHLDPGRVERGAVEALVPTIEMTRLRPEVGVG